MAKLADFDWFDKIRGWIKKYVAQEVPDDLSACEFDCRQLDCCQEKWESCERRKQSERGQEEEKL